MNSKFSDLNNVSTEVPKFGGELLLFIYIHFVFFADNTCLKLANHSSENHIHNFDTELSKLFNWFIQNRVLLINDKTVVTNFSERITRSESELKLDDHYFNSVASTKYLGVVSHSKLSFSSHIDYKSSKI